MRKNEYAGLLKGKSVADLLELIRLGQTGKSKIDPDQLDTVIDEFNSRELSETETKNYENLMSIFDEETPSLKTKSKARFTEEEKNETSTYRIKDSEPARYNALKTISGLISILGYIVIGIGIIGFFYLVDDNQTFMGFINLFVSVIVSLSLLAFSKLIYVFIDIERNTRKTQELLNKK